MVSREDTADVVSCLCPVACNGESVLFLTNEVCTFGAGVGQDLLSFDVVQAKSLVLGVECKVLVLCELSTVGKDAVTEGDISNNLSCAKDAGWN